MNPLAPALLVVALPLQPSAPFTSKEHRFRVTLPAPWRRVAPEEAKGRTERPGRLIGLWQYGEGPLDDSPLLTLTWRPRRDPGDPRVTGRAWSTAGPDRERLVEEVRNKVHRALAIRPDTPGRKPRVILLDAGWDRERGCLHHHQRIVLPNLDIYHNRVLWFFGEDKRIELSLFGPIPDVERAGASLEALSRTFSFLAPAPPRSFWQRLGEYKILLLGILVGGSWLLWIVVRGAALPGAKPGTGSS